MAIDEIRLSDVEKDVTNLRVDQATLRAQLSVALNAITTLTSSVERLTATMNRAAGERAAAKAAYAFVGTVLGALGALVVQWYASHK